MKSTTLLFLLILLSFEKNYASNVNLNQDSLKKATILIGEYQALRSTHSTIFNGFNFVYAKQINSKNTVGIGIEYSSAPFHGDNGYNLYDLNFLPFFLDYRHDLLFNKALTPFLLADVGYTFVGYDRIEDGKPDTKTRIKEGGIYLNAAIGIKYKIFKNLYPNFSFGFKGFHNSFNNLDINPHGLVFRTGLAVKI